MKSIYNKYRRLEDKKKYLPDDERALIAFIIFLGGIVFAILFIKVTINI